MAEPSPVLYRPVPASSLEIGGRVERALHEALASASPPFAPPRLAEALRYAVFPGGARLRPGLCVVAALACGDDYPAATDSAAAAVELLHCASLVHDDLPCFDDADTRRGKPSVHRAFGQATAVLVGDALIVLAFEAVARAASISPHARGELTATLAFAAGPSHGLVAGQAWESEPAIDVEDYHRAKTASLFEASAALGALAQGADPRPWRALGSVVGRAYQCADDLRDATGTPRMLGKPAGRDAVLRRPSVVRRQGVSVARQRLAELVTAAWGSLPAAPNQHVARGWLENLTGTLSGELPSSRSSG
ncbi:MAG: polyprenyl synthetase family protein [Myxococcota bacterium]|nr:polyprenyl synthetase family protein [Myxococcota bacterium]